MIASVRATLVLAILAYWPGLIEQFETPKAAVVGVLGAGLLATALASLLAGRARPVPACARHRVPAREAATAPVRWDTIDLCMLVWLAVEIASTATSVAPTISLFGDTDQREGLLTSIGLVGLFAATRLATTGVASARRTLHVMLAAVGAACLVALWQLATFDRTQWQNAPEYLGWYRPFGSLGHANLLGLAAAAAFSATLGLAPSRASRWWRVGAVLLFGATTVLTLSRAAWLALPVGSIATLATGASLRARAGRTMRPGRAAVAWFVAATLLAVALVAAVEPLRVRVLELVALGSGSGRSRREIWASAIAMWRAHPWLGSGPDTFHLLFDRFQTPGYWLAEWSAAPFHAHSIYFDALATRGVAGVLVAAAVALAAFQALRRGARTEAGGRDLVPAIAGLLVAIAVAGMTGALGVAGAAVVACGLGLLPALAGPRAPARARAFHPGTRATVPLVAGVFAGLLVLLPSLAWLRASHAAFVSDEEQEAGAAIATARRAAVLAPWSDVMASHAADVLRRRASRTPDPDAALALAEGEARRATVLAPQRLYDQSELALVLLLRGGGTDSARTRQATAAIERCAALGPFNTMPLVHYADLANRLGRGDLAIPPGRRAAAVYPGEALPHALLGEAYRKLGDRATARAEFVRSLSLEWRGDAPRRAWAERMLKELGAGSPESLGVARR